MNLGLYIHIPFCNQICNYCDFSKRIGNDKAYLGYINALIEEIKSYKSYLNKVDTIYIGGGTPSLFPIEYLTTIVNKLNDYLDVNNVVEFSIETNPDDITYELIAKYKELGINRVSVGVQTFNNDLLSLLNRKHTYETSVNALNTLKNSNISNINIDLMFGIPNQTIEDIKNDLNILKELDFINHVSYYSLILEENTKFYTMYDKDILDLPSEELEFEQSELIDKELSNLGYKKYEISNYSKDDNECIHNIKYWKNREYIGVGLAAHGFLNGIRYENTKSFKDYIGNNNTVTEYDDTKEDKLLTKIIMGLRLKDGINISEINTNYEIDFLRKYKFINKFIKEEYLILNNNNLSFTDKGFLLSNEILANFFD